MSLTPRLLIEMYARGYFPMARSRQGDIEWFSADPRSVIPLHPPDAFKVSRNLAKRVRKGDYLITTDQAFRQVMTRCAQPRTYESETWINDEMIEVYTRLHELGFAHSVEAWRSQHTDSVAPSGRIDFRDGACFHDGELPTDAELVGGLYGVSLAGAFFGESMFSQATDASKVCLVHLVRHLQRQGYLLLDSQIHNHHIAQFGAIEIAQDQYHRQLHQALQISVKWR